MTVRIKRGKLRLGLWLPFAFAGFALKSIVKNKTEGGVGETEKREIKEMLKSLKAAKKIHGKIELVSVKCADGDSVKIVI